MKKFFPIVLSFLLVIQLVISCKTEIDDNSFSVITWNTYLFFDSRSDGDEYSGFKVSDGYTGAVYLERVKACALMMAKEFADSDVIILQEVESNIVLHDLLEHGLKKKGFRYYGVADNGSSPVSIGFISKRAPNLMLVHGIDDRRLLLELSFEVKGERISIIAIHATSRLSGGEAERFEEFSLLRKIADDNIGNVVLLAGDYNADPNGAEMGFANIRKSHSEDTPIVLTGNPGECCSGVYFSQALDYMNDIGNGTYLYDGSWYFYDNILVSHEGFDGSGWEYGYSEIVAPYESVDLNGSPMKFDSSTKKGMSDHLPLKCVLGYH